MRKSLLILVMLAGGFTALRAQSNSDAMGLFKLGAYDSAGNYLGLLSNSDTLISLPFTRAHAFDGTVQAVSGNVITIAGSPAWTSNQYVHAGATQPDTYYVWLGAATGTNANPLEGRIYTVTANSANTLTVDLNGDDISQVPASTQIAVIPYWTLATLFPASSATVSFTPSMSTRTFKTEVLLVNNASVGINLAYSETYYFISNGTNIGWRLFGDATTTDHGNDILVPNSYFVVRNFNSAPTLPLEVVGQVAAGKLSLPLATAATVSQDNALGLTRPLDISLNSTGLNPASGSFKATAATRLFQDELFLYNNATVSQNKAPSATYYYLNNAWRLFGDAPTTDHGGDLIPTGCAITVRKVPTSDGVTSFWTNPSTY